MIVFIAVLIFLFFSFLQKFGVAYTKLSNYISFICFKQQRLE